MSIKQEASDLTEMIMESARRGIGSSFQEVQSVLSMETFGTELDDKMDAISAAVNKSEKVLEASLKKFIAAELKKL